MGRSGGGVLHLLQGDQIGAAAAGVGGVEQVTRRAASSSGGAGCSGTMGKSEGRGRRRPTCAAADGVYQVTEPEGTGLTGSSKSTITAPYFLFPSI